MGIKCGEVSRLLGVFEERLGPVLAKAVTPALLATRVVWNTFFIFFRGESATTQAGRVPPEQLSSKLGYAAVKIPNKEARVAPWDSRSFL